MKTVKLGDVCELITRGISPKYTEDEKLGVVVLNQKCIRNKTVLHEFGRLHNLSIKSVNKSKYLRSGDVLVNSTGQGTLGRTALAENVDKPLLVDSHVTILRPVVGLFEPRYFAYLIGQSENDFIDMATGTSGQTELPRALLNEHLVSYEPPLEEQRRIVARLDAAFEKIDRAIELTQQNFSNSQILFENELQNIFDQHDISWEQKTLKNIAKEFGRGKSKHRPRNDKMLYGGDYPFIQTGDVRNSDHLIAKFSQTYNENGLSQSKLWPKGTICITIAANIAETGILTFDACFPDSIIGVVVDESQTSNNYVEYLLQSFKVRLQSLGKGSAQDNINLGTFENELFPFPSLAEQVKIVKRLNDLSAITTDLKNAYTIKLMRLSALKQAMLKQAFNDKVES